MSQQEDKMVSVCLTTYNGASYLREQLNSILCQLGAEDELIISDDGSKDESLAIIKGMNDSRIKVFHNPGPHGVNGNFENAIRHSRGEYIFLSDQDDVWCEGKVAQCLAALKAADLVVHDAIITDKELHPQNKTLFSELNIKTGFLNNFIRNRFTGCCMAFRKEVLPYIIPFPKGVGFYHDNWIGLLVSLKGRVVFIDSKLILFRRHQGNNSSAASESRLGIYDKIKYRLSLGKNILTRIIKR